MCGDKRPPPPLSHSSSHTLTHFHLSMFYDWTTCYQLRQYPHVYTCPPKQDEEHQPQPQQGPVQALKDEALEGEKGEEQEKPRNERERRRVKQVNAAFTVLRNHLPSTPSGASKSKRRVDSGRRLSKVKTLRAAIRYIDELTKMLKSPE